MFPARHFRLKHEQVGTPEKNQRAKSHPPPEARRRQQYQGALLLDAGLKVFNPSMSDGRRGGEPKNLIASSFGYTQPGGPIERAPSANDSTQ